MNETENSEYPSTNNLLGISNLGMHFYYSASAVAFLTWLLYDSLYMMALEVWCIAYGILM
tara:strand:+ start:166 stop:345 length:180 start_codon:yes stop_codon:yes gene_type:complete